AVDKENWWKYGLAGAAVGGIVGGLTAETTRSLGSKLPGQHNNKTTNPGGNTRYPRYKKTLTRELTLFEYQEFIADGFYTLPFQKIVEFGPNFRRFSFFGFNGNTYYDGDLYRNKRDIGYFSI